MAMTLLPGFREGSIGLLALCLLLLACNRAPASLPEDIADCPDAACREAWILHPDHADPARQAAALQTIAQPEERIVLVKKILDANPHQPPEICGQLPRGDARQYCERIQDRPHLVEPPPVASVDAQRPGGGPSNIELGGTPGGGFVAALAPAEAGCEEAADVRACRSQEALRLAGQRQIEGAARACLTLGAGRWQGECLFSAAEAALKAGAPYAQAMQMCLAAEPFSQQCHSHLISSLAIQSPSATSPAGLWAPSIHVAAQLESAWADFDAGMGVLAVDRFWSEAVRLSYIDQPAVGDPLDTLPAAAAPHVRAAVTWQLLSTTASPPATLAEWVTLAEAAMASRSSQPQPPLSVRERKRLNLWIRDYWASDAPGEEDIPARYYLGTSRRPADADPRTDLTLCLLEGLARQKQANHALFEEASRSEVAVIAWSAARLKRHLPRN